jgi:hypothetical protein
MQVSAIAFNGLASLLAAKNDTNKPIVRVVS